MLHVGQKGHAEGLDCGVVMKRSGDQHISGAALAGLASLVERNARRRDRLDQWMHQLATHAADLHDAHVQSEAARALFGAMAREITIALADTTDDGDKPRHRARKLLAAKIIELAGRALTAMREGEQSTTVILSWLRAKLEELGDLGDLPRRAAAFEMMRLRPLSGFTGKEWALLQEGPIYAVLHVSAAASNGPRELLREFRQADNAMLELSLAPDRDPVVGAAMHAGLCRNRLRQLADDYPSRRLLLGQLQSCLAVAEKAGTVARTDYGDVVVAAARAAAGAACERVLFSRRRELEAESRALEEIGRLMH